MPTRTATNPDAIPKARARAFGLVGIIVAFLGLAGAIFAPLAFEVQRPPPKQLSDVLADTAVKIKDSVTRREAAAPPPPPTDWRGLALITPPALGFIRAALCTAGPLCRVGFRIR